jgi:hypothetical protein
MLVVWWYPYPGWPWPPLIGGSWCAPPVFDECALLPLPLPPAPAPLPPLTLACTLAGMAPLAP